MITGIDVSKFQGDIDWKKVEKTDAKFAFIKATQGVTIVDSQFRNNWKKIQETNLKFSAYHFFHSNADPKAQAKLFIDTIGDIPSKNLLPFVVDVERWEKSDTKFNKEELQESIFEFCNIVENVTQHKVIIYTGSWFSLENLGDALSHLGLWVAHYSVSKPKISKAWDHWLFWQFTDKGSFSGINGNVDTNYFNGTMDELSALCRETDNDIVSEPISEPSVEIPDTNKVKSHVVVKGESLYKIAKKYETTIESLLKLNPFIKNPNRINVGQVIVL